MIGIKEKIEKGEATLKERLGISNRMAVPKITKVVISSGTGSAKDKKRNEVVESRLIKITGQKPSLRRAKKSIAGFKSREGDVMGYMITLRGARMYGFLDKLINVAIPRMRDFRGLDRKSIDAVGNMTIGIKEHTIFPETTDEDLRDVFGFAVTVATTARDKKSAEELLTLAGFPFKK